MRSRQSGWRRSDAEDAPVEFITKMDATHRLLSQLFPGALARLSCIKVR